MQPDLSISTSFSYEIPIEDQVPLMAEAGFTYLSLGAQLEHSGYLIAEQRARLKELLCSHGLRVDTIHARGLDRPDALSEAAATVEAAADLKARCVVVHAGPFELDEAEVDRRLCGLLETCAELRAVAKAAGLGLALENVMPGLATDLVRRALPRLDGDVFGLCYDSSHAQICGRPLDLLDEFPDRLIAVHLSDRIGPFMDHVIPGEGLIDWSALCARLRAAGYDRPLLLEVHMKHSHFTEPRVFLAQAHEAGARMWRLMNEE